MASRLVDQGAPGKQGPWDVKIKEIDPSVVIPVVVNDLTASGTISTRNLNPGGAATANSAVEISCNDRSTVTIQLAAAWAAVGGLSAQVTTDGTNWITVQHVLLRASTGAQTSTIATGLLDIWQIDVTGHAKFRITAISGAVTTPAVVTLRASQAGQPQLLASITPSLSAVTQTDGSIAVGGVAQNALAANTNRKYFAIVNNSDTDMFIRIDGVAATANSGLIKAGGGSYESPPNFCSTSAVSVYCATAGKRFTTLEG